MLAKWALEARQRQLIRQIFFEPVPRPPVTLCKKTRKCTACARVIRVAVYAWIAFDRKNVGQVPLPHDEATSTKVCILGPGPCNWESTRIKAIFFFKDTPWSVEITDPNFPMGHHEID